MHPQHQHGQFMIPQREAALLVGVVPVTYTDPVQDEVAEIAAEHARSFLPAESNHRNLVRFGLAIVAMCKGRAAGDVEDFSGLDRLAAAGVLTPAARSKLVATELGRLLDWICHGRQVLDMGVRVAVVASHIRARAIDHRTDQELALEVGNDSRESVSKVRREFRRDLGANYPGEHGKATNTKTRCKNSRLQNLTN